MVGCKSLNNLVCLLSVQKGLIVIMIIIKRVCAAMATDDYGIVYTVVKIIGGFIWAKKFGQIRDIYKIDIGHKVLSQKMTLKWVLCVQILLTI